MEHSSIPVVLATIGVLVLVSLLVIGAVLVRQLVVAREQGAFGCTLQRTTLRGERWQHGLMRIGRDRLAWYHVRSLRVSPSVLVLRRRIEGVSRRRLPAQYPEADDACLVEFAMRDGSRVRAIVDESSGAALNAWLEAAPVGVVIGDAD